MTTAHLEKFVEMIVTDPDLRGRLGRAVDETSSSAYINNVMTESKAQSLNLAREEVMSWLHLEQARVRRNEGDLSDEQLAAVAGGAIGTIAAKGPDKCCANKGCQQPTNCQAASRTKLPKSLL